MKHEVYKNEKGQFHRVDGPAVINDIRKVWYYKGQFHRLDGPAYIEGNYHKWCIYPSLAILAYQFLEDDD